jgi:hypothetical protein
VRGVVAFLFFQTLAAGPHPVAHVSRSWERARGLPTACWALTAGSAPAHLPRAAGLFKPCAAKCDFDRHTQSDGASAGDNATSPRSPFRVFSC